MKLSFCSTLSSITPLRTLAKKIAKYCTQDPKVYGLVLCEMIEDAAKAYSSYAGMNSIAQPDERKAFAFPR